MKFLELDPVASHVKPGENEASYTKKYWKNVNILQDSKNRIRIFAYKQILYPCRATIMQVFAIHKNSCVMVSYLYGYICFG